MPEIKHNIFGSVGSKHQESNKPTQANNQMDQVDLKSLIELGCIKDTLVIENMSFAFRTLNVNERMMASDFLGENPNARKMFDFNVLVLAMAIESVNGVPLENMYNQNDKDYLEIRKQIISNFQPAVLSQLLNFYSTLTNRADAQFTGEQVKN